MTQATTRCIISFLLKKKKRKKKKKKTSDRIQITLYPRLEYALLEQGSLLNTNFRNYYTKKIDERHVIQTNLTMYHDHG